MRPLEAFGHKEDQKYGDGVASRPAVRGRCFQTQAGVGVSGRACENADRATQVSFGARMRNETVVHPDNRVLFSAAKK